MTQKEETAIGTHQIPQIYPSIEKLIDKYKRRGTREVSVHIGDYLPALYFKCPITRETHAFRVASVFINDITTHGQLSDDNGRYTDYLAQCWSTAKPPNHLRKELARRPNHLQIGFIPSRFTRYFEKEEAREVAAEVKRVSEGNGIEARIYEIRSHATKWSRCFPPTDWFEVGTGLTLPD